MKSFHRLPLFIIVFISLFLTTSAQADIQKTINFQGFLTNSNDEAVDDKNYSMSFSLWDGSDDSTASKVWEETQQVSVSRGIYSVNLGETTPFPYTLNFAEQYYLGVQVGNDSIMKINGSLIPIVSTWHSFRSDTSGGRHIKSVSQNYTLAGTDDVLLVSGDVTITLPSAEDMPKKWFTIKKMDDDNTTVTIVTSNGEQINNVSSLSMSSQFSDVSLISDSQKWVSIGFSDLSLNHLYTKTEIDTSISTGSLSVSGNLTTNTLLIEDLIKADSAQLTKMSITDVASIDQLSTESLNVTASFILIDETLKISNTTLVSTASTSKTISLPDSSGVVVVTKDGSVIVPDNAITSAKIADGAITGADLQNGAISYTQIASGGISTDRLAASGSNALSSGSVGQSLRSNGDGSFFWETIISSPFSPTTATISGVSFAYSFGTQPFGEFDKPKGIAVGQDGTIIVADTGDDRIQVFSSSGDFAYSIGTDSSGNNIGQFNDPEAVAVDKNGKIYVADTGNDRIQVFSCSGAYEYSFGTYGSNVGQMKDPTDIEIDKNDKIYVADKDNDRIQIFSSSGSYEYSIGTGSSGSDPGEFNDPYGVAVDSNGKIYVADEGNDRIQVFTSSGAYEYSIGKGSSGSNIGEFDDIRDVEVDNNGKIYAADEYNERIQVFTSSGAYDYSIGVTRDDGKEPGRFDAPNAVAIDNNGNIYSI
ncbi:NHL repeat containing protein, partial [Candidatus Magnetomorum sp. HK-1]